MIAVLSRFQRSHKGSVTIEFIFAILVLCLMLMFMLDLSLMRLQIGKLDNTSYSLVNILRERRQLFNESNTKEYTTEDAEKAENLCTGSTDTHDCRKLVLAFEKLANQMFFGTTKSQKGKKIYVRLDALQFWHKNCTNNALCADFEKNFNIKHHWVVSNIPDDLKNDCVPSTNIRTLQNVAPISEVDPNRKLPLYQVTLCLPTVSFFNTFVPNEQSNGRVLRSSSLAVGR